MDDPNFKWLTSHYPEVWERYAGQWIAVANEQVAGAGETPAAALAQARKKFPAAKVLFSFVEEETNVIYLLL